MENRSSIGYRLIQLVWHWYFNSTAPYASSVISHLEKYLHRPLTEKEISDVNFVVLTERYFSYGE